LVTRNMQSLFDTLLNGPARYMQSHNYDPFLTLAVVLGVLMVEFGAVYILFKIIWFLILHIRWFVGWMLRICGIGERKVEYAFLQLVFPADTTRSAYATEQLHILLRSTVGYYSFWERLAARKQPYSLELVATKNEGIRYIVRIPQQEAEVVRRTLLSFLPGLKIAETDDYTPELTGRLVRVTELRLANDFVLPLGANKALDEHDPIAYLTGHMRNLGADELVAVQIVTVPVFSHTHADELRRRDSFANRIALNQELASAFKRERMSASDILFMTILMPFWALGLGLKFCWSVLGVLAERGLQDGDRRSVGDPYEQELGEAVKGKLDQHLFEVSIRVLVSSPDVQGSANRINALVSAFGTYTNARQGLRMRRYLPWYNPNGKNLRRFMERALSPHILSWPTIVSSSELSDLYHFPNTDLTKTEGLIKSRSRDLPAPLSQKREATPFDVVVGRNEFDGHSQDVGITLKQRQKHTYVLGKTGTGKTTMLMGMIYQDMVNGKGLAVLDPHGDMFRELLRIVPKHRRDDVVVFDPADREFPVGLNILEPGIEFDNEDDKHEWITSTVLSVFAKLAEENQWGPRMEHILRNATLTALQTPSPSLYTLQRLLTDKKYQQEVAKSLKDPVLKQFWQKEFKLMGSMQMSSVTAPLTHRLGRFITAKMSRHILLQEKSTLRIADVMNEGKILLVNLSKGDIGEDQSFFFGTILTSFMWMAAYQRTKIPERERRDFLVYVDEFQNFATPQFGAITSEGRKFRVSLVVSHQTISQMEDKDLVRVIAGNAATMICLKASPDDEAFILPYMKPEVEKGDIVNLAPYHFYMKVTGDEAEDAFSGQTVPLDVQISNTVVADVTGRSRRKYASLQADVEKWLESVFEGTLQPFSRKQIRSKDAPTKPKRAVIHDV
jgi:hypothetical protein